MESDHSAEPPPATEMLKPPAHRVAGHRAEKGALGPLIDGSGHFYKPLQSDNRGAAKLAFYTAFSGDSRAVDHIGRFFPAFFGTMAVHSGAGDLHPHLVLEDLVAGLHRPAVADVKIGACTWSPSSASGYLSKCIKKDLETTSARIGFRISGLQVSLAGGDEEGQVWKPGREAMKRLATADT